MANPTLPEIEEGGNLSTRAAGFGLIRFNKSGPITPLGDGIRITMVHAEHSSDVVHTDPASKNLQLDRLRFGRSASTALPPARITSGMPA